MPDAAGAQPDMVEPELNQEVLSMLLQMGIPEIQAKHAVFNTGNSDAEMASMWFFENIENPAIQVPLMVKNPKKEASAAPQKKAADPESLIFI